MKQIPWVDQKKSENLVIHVYDITLRIPYSKYLENQRKLLRVEGKHLSGLRLSTIVHYTGDECLLLNLYPTYGRHGP